MPVLGQEGKLPPDNFSSFLVLRIQLFFFSLRLRYAKCWRKSISICFSLLCVISPGFVNAHSNQHRSKVGEN